MPRHARPLVDRFVDAYSPEPNTGCWLWTLGVHTFGYGLIRIAGTRETVGAHRVAWELFRGPIPDGLWVLHRCDQPGCVNPAHLFLGTCSDNEADKVAKGRQARGPTHGMYRNPKALRGDRCSWSRLTEAGVRAIRAKYATHEASQYELADEFGVSQRTIWNVLHWEWWKHVA